MVANGKNFSTEGANHLPQFEEPGSGYVRCLCSPAATLMRDIEAYKFMLASKRNKGSRAVKKKTDEESDSVIYMGTMSTWANTSLNGSGWTSASRAGLSSEYYCTSNVLP